MRRVVIACIVGALLSMACSDQTHHPRLGNESGNREVSAMSNNQLLIKLGEPGTDFARRYPQKIRVSHQPAGLDFYTARWPKPPHGELVVQSGEHSFAVKNVLSVQSAQELGPLANEGLYEFTINAGITEPELIAHDEARLKTHEILAEILRAGWRPIVPLSRPRLAGAARLDYALNVSDSIGLDPRQAPTFEEWMRLENGTGWFFHAPGAYLSISFTRERTLTDPAKLGSYMLTFNLQTEAEYFRGYVESDDRPRWRDFFPKALPALASARAQKESELKAKGVPIDQTYVDPPIPRQ